MGTRSKLFASAAFPLLSLSLMLQPANAAVLRGQSTTVSDTALDRAGAYEVAQEQAPDGGQDDQDPRKHKKHGAEGQPGEPQQQEQKEQKKEPAGEPKPPAAEPPKAEAPKEEAPKAEPPKAEAPKAEAPKAAPAPEPKAEQPKAAPAAQPEAAPEPPKPHKQEAEQPKATPAPKAAAEQPAAPAAQPDAQPEPPKKKAKQAEEPAAEQEATPTAPKPAGEPAAAQQQDGQQPKKHQKPAEKPVEAAQPAEPAAPPAAAKTEEAKPAAKPAGEQQPAAAEENPAPKAPVEGKAAQPADQAAPTPTAEKPAAAKPVEAGKGQPPAPANAPADAAKTPPAGAASPAVAEQPAPAGEQVSPAEIERRKKIAENPAAATGPVILPVQNGAAVLDSDKDAARRGHRQGGNGQPGQGGQRPAGQAQGGQAPAGQAPAGQAQGQAQGQGGQRPPEPANAKPPTSDADAQRGQGGRQAPPVKIEAVTSEQGRRMDQRPNFAPPDGAEVEGRQDNRVILNFGDDVFVRHDDTQRFTRDGERPSYEQLSRDRYRETIARPDGTRIVTVRNRHGDIIQRSSIDPRGREYVLFYAPELEDQPDQDYYRDPGDDLPPMRLRIPLNQYIIDTSNDRNQDYYDFLREPPVEQVERVYSLNEVRYSARIRDKVRRIDLDTITFATGSADIPMTQAKTLRGIADAIGKIIKKDPSETFLIEGHTDAVGSAQSNLVLSDQRAESVANLLTDVYGIPPENLATQGYGEQYLKVNTSGPEQENRRVTIRRVTALVRPVASRQ